MSSDDTPLDGCHCCEGQAEPGVVYNAPGLSALSWRIDTQPGVYQRMLARLPLWHVPGVPASAPRPLAALRTREPDDAAVALVDASACVADVLMAVVDHFERLGCQRCLQQGPHPGDAFGVGGRHAHGSTGLNGRTSTRW